MALQKQTKNLAISVPTDSRPLDELLAKEWLLSNSRGGYASSTVVGCNTRRYHGLLVGALNPPANRIMALANCLEMLVLNGRSYNLATFQFPDTFAPDGYKYLNAFRRDTGAHFDYQCDDIAITKSVYLLPDSDTVVLAYQFHSLPESCEFIIRPFIGLRDFHSLQKSYASLHCTPIEDGLLIRHDVPQSCELFLTCPDSNFEKDPQWWFNFTYSVDKERGQEFAEDLWTPGFFRAAINSPGTIVLYANLSTKYTHDQAKTPDIDAVRSTLDRHQRTISAPANADKTLAALYLAADQFIVHRCSQGRDHTTILAGYPWFDDWGRDAFIALPGLLLATERLDQAKSVLTTFANAADNGMIPNRFDDYSCAAHFNSIDASLWFINAAFQYLDASRDRRTFTELLLPMILAITDAYRNGTGFGIHADDDGLITAGDRDTQLTWMDAKYAGIAFTPRYGKAVEVNALWYNALMLLAEFYENSDATDTEHSHDTFLSTAEKVRQSFSAIFWNHPLGHLNDCVLPDGSVDNTLRPNQIFAVSLPFSPLSREKQKCVVDTVRRKLLTPCGLRTLPRDDPRYQGAYTGPRQQRDRAYHQGTVWPWLIGPFVEAYLKVNNFSRKSKTKAAEFIEPLLTHLTERGCIGQVCEICDGDHTHEPKGCFAQAWSVAELIRAYLLINR